MSDQVEPIYLVANNINNVNSAIKDEMKIINVIQQANQFKNVHILNNVDNIPPQFVLQQSSRHCPTIVELKPPPLPVRPSMKHRSTKRQHLNRQRTIDQINNLKEQSRVLVDNLKEFFSLSTELTFRLVILFVIYLSIIYNLYRSLAALYLIESNFRSTFHYLTASRRAIYSIFMLFNLFVDCYGVYTLLKKSIVHIFFYAISLTTFSLFLLILFGSLVGYSVIMSLLIASLCYLFTYLEYQNCQPETEVCQQCVHHIHHV